MLSTVIVQAGLPRKRTRLSDLPDTNSIDTLELCGNTWQPDSEEQCHVVQKFILSQEGELPQRITLRSTLSDQIVWEQTEQGLPNS